MNLVYNSANFSVVEYPTLGGYEVIDKHTRTTAYVHGDMATQFRDSMQALIERDPSQESIDDFLDDYDSAPAYPMTYH